MIGIKMLLHHKEIKQTTPTPTVGVTFVKSLKNVYHIDQFYNPFKKVSSYEGVWYNDRTIDGITETEYKISNWFERLKKEKQKQIYQQMKVDYQNIRKIDLCYKDICDFCLKDNPKLFLNGYPKPSDKSWGEYFVKSNLNRLGSEVEDVVIEKCHSLLKKFNCNVQYIISEDGLQYFHSIGEI